MLRQWDKHLKFKSLKSEGQEKPTPKNDDKLIYRKYSNTFASWKFLIIHLLGRDFSVIARVFLFYKEKVNKQYWIYATRQASEYTAQFGNNRQHL